MSFSRRHKKPDTKKQPKLQAGGLSVAASTQEPPSAPPQVSDECTVVPKSKDKVAFACGHEDFSVFAHNFFGAEFPVNAAFLRSRVKCGACMLAEVRPLLIHCAVCGRVIFPGDAVAVYDNDASFNKAWVTAADEKATGVIGCLRMDCCPSGGFFAGHWNGRSFEPAFVHGNAALEAFFTGQVVIVSTEKKK